MSEYQYYEFLAIDRPLTAEEMADLRAISTRAHITPVSFTNEYHWGDLKGRPENLMQRYFDAHVYVANWMTAVFMLRMPIDALDGATAEAVAVRHVLDIKAAGAHWIIIWRLEESENYDRFGIEDGRGWMARLAPVRDELLRGDLRSLYIGWLAAVTRGITDDDEMEPLPAAGMGNLTMAQRALAEFIEVDEDLLAGAGMGCEVLQDDSPSPKDVDEWMDQFTRETMKTILKPLLDGKGQQVERSIKNQFAAWWRGLRGRTPETPRRTVGELRTNSETAERIRLEKQKRQKEQRELKRRREREAYLKSLSQDFPKAWKAVQQTVERWSGLAYDEGCRALVDLAEAYALNASVERFQGELRGFVADHKRRKALIQRLVQAGLWNDS
jgi:hypothetical protein